MKRVLSPELEKLLRESDVLNREDIDFAKEMVSGIVFKPTVLTVEAAINVLVAMQEMSLGAIEPAIEENMALMKMAFGSEYQYSAENDNTEFGQMYKMYETIKIAVEALKSMKVKLNEKPLIEVLKSLSMPTIVMDLYHMGNIKTDADLLMILLLSDKINGLARNRDRSSVINWVESYLNGNINDMDETVLNLITEMGWTGEEILTAESIVTLTINLNQISRKKLENQMQSVKNEVELQQLEQAHKVVTNILDMWTTNTESITNAMQERFDKGLKHIFIEQGLPDPGLENVSCLTVRQYLNIYFYLSKNR